MPVWPTSELSRLGVIQTELEAADLVRLNLELGADSFQQGLAVLLHHFLGNVEGGIGLGVLLYQFMMGGACKPPT